MKSKMKMLLLSAFLCLVIGLQSVEMVQASVYYEACPFCGTRVVRSQKTKVLNMTYSYKCTVHDGCDIYMVTYGSVQVTSCQTAGCAGYDREGDLVSSWTSSDAHVTQ